MTQQASPHIPVMLDEVLQTLAPAKNAVIVDGTFGHGGYSRAILDAEKTCHVIGIDRDPNVVEKACALEAANDRFRFVEGCFGDMDSLLAQIDTPSVDGVVLDIGVSSMQIDEPGRGFSFRFDGPLDMRMSQEGESAADIVNHYPEQDIANIIYEYGEERLSRQIAKAIIKTRQNAPITTTAQLADIVRAVVRQSPKDKSDPATRTFQALRIYVNDELGELKRGLAAAEKILSPNGRLVVVTFHSLEDSIVKNFLNERSGRNSGGSRYAPDLRSNSPLPTFALHAPKHFGVSDAEASRNPRARSAKLRYATRTDAPARKEAA